MATLIVFGSWHDDPVIFKHPVVVDVPLTALMKHERARFPDRHLNTRKIMVAVSTDHGGVVEVNVGDYDSRDYGDRYRSYPAVDVNRMGIDALPNLRVLRIKAPLFYAGLFYHYPSSTTAFNNIQALSMTGSFLGLGFLSRMPKLRDLELGGDLYTGTTVRSLLQSQKLERIRWSVTLDYLDCDAADPDFPTSKFALFVEVIKKLPLLSVLDWFLDADEVDEAQLVAKRKDLAHHVTDLQIAPKYTPPN